MAGSEDRSLFMFEAARPEWGGPLGKGWARDRDRQGWGTAEEMLLLP